MKKFTLLLLLLMGCPAGIPVPSKTYQEPIVHNDEYSLLPVWHEKYLTAEVELYGSSIPEADLSKIQCPIPAEDRVKNYTGVQCVFSSIECLGRWAEYGALTNPPLTSRSDCKGRIGPIALKAILDKYKIKYKMTNWYEASGEALVNQGIALIKEAMREGRGCMWTIPGHAMVMVHYDEATDTVMWIDNADRNLRVQKSTVKWFKSVFTGWVVIVYANPDVAPYKSGRYSWGNTLPIIDKNGKPEEQYPFDYIPLPKTGSAPLSPTL